MEDYRGDDSIEMNDSFHEAELHLEFSVPKWLKNIFTINGFDEQILLSKIEDVDIVNTEHFAKTILPDLIDLDKYL